MSKKSSSKKAAAAAAAEQQQQQQQQQQQTKTPFTPFVIAERFADKPERQRIARITQDGRESQSIAAGAKIGHYVVGLAKTPSGKRTLDIGDEVAGLLRGKDTEAILKITEDRLLALGAECPDLKAKYGHLNPGQIRMNCGNRLRNAIKADREAQGIE